MISRGESVCRIEASKTRFDVTVYRGAICTCTTSSHVPVVTKAMCRVNWMTGNGELGRR